jgi:hypothetical protein
MHDIKRDVAAIIAITKSTQPNTPGEWALKFKDITLRAGACTCAAVIENGEVQKLEYCDRCTDCLYRYTSKTNTLKWLKSRWEEMNAREEDEVVMQNFVYEFLDTDDTRRRKVKLGPIHHSWVFTFDATKVRQWHKGASSARKKVRSSLLCAIASPSCHCLTLCFLCFFSKRLTNITSRNRPPQSQSQKNGGHSSILAT